MLPVTVIEITHLSDTAIYLARVSLRMLGRVNRQRSNLSVGSFSKKYRFSPMKLGWSNSKLSPGESEF